MGDLKFFDEQMQRWYMEWINYFRTENTKTHFSLPEDFEPPPIDEIERLLAPEVFELVFERERDKSIDGLMIWVDGSDLVKKYI